MKGMTQRTTYWAKGENPEKGFSTDKVILEGKAVILETPSGTLRIENGNRIASARIIRQKPAEPQTPIKVTGWDRQMNNVRTVCSNMDEAMDLACTLLHAKLRPMPERR